MPTYEKIAPSHDVAKTAKAIMLAVSDHKPISEVLKIDFVFAHADLDDDGEPTNFAITSRGIRALAQTRIINLKDRAKGNGDAEILIDADHWEEVSESEQRAILDHELTHIQICVKRDGQIKTDDLGRPKLKLRKHDVDVGWFSMVAKRHGAASVEQIQAKAILDAHGQYLFPQLMVENVQMTARQIRA